MHERRVPVLPVRRRPSEIDPAPTSWAVIGGGARGRACVSALRAAGVPVVGYERSPSGCDAELFRCDHEVIAINEIEDVDALAVTSHDSEGAIHTDYFFGVVLAVAADEAIVDHCVEEELLPGVPGAPVLGRNLFTPRHPALVGLGISRGAPSNAAGDTKLETDVGVIVEYAVQLRDDPRAALGFHRAACSA